MPHFYDTLAPYYHLIFPDWEASMRRQAQALDSLLQTRGVATGAEILDASCGVGTQTLGLAAQGYTLTASDLSAGAVERASREAADRGLEARFSVADIREAFEHHGRSFDAVIACDNSIPHLLSDEEILRALRQLYLCTAPDGVCIISVRDYDSIEQGGVQFHPYGTRQVGNTRYVIFQLWEWEGKEYDTTLYIVEERPDQEPLTLAMRTRYYAVSIPTLIGLMREAGFVHVERVDGEFFQPVLIGRRQAS